MLYRSLIAALLLIWYKRQTGIDRGWRSVKFWLADDVRQWTEQALRQDLQALQGPPVGAASPPPGVQPDTG